MTTNNANSAVCWPLSRAEIEVGCMHASRCLIPFPEGRLDASRWPNLLLVGPVATTRRSEAAAEVAAAAVAAAAAAAAVAAAAAAAAAAAVAAAATAAVQQ